MKYQVTVKHLVKREGVDVLGRSTIVVDAADEVAAGKAAGEAAKKAGFLEPRPVTAKPW